MIIWERQKQSIPEIILLRLFVMFGILLFYYYSPVVSIIMQTTLVVNLISVLYQLFNIANWNVILGAGLYSLRAFKFMMMMIIIIIIIIIIVDDGRLLTLCKAFGTNFITLCYCAMFYCTLELKYHWFGCLDLFYKVEIRVFNPKHLAVLMAGYTEK